LRQKINSINNNKKVHLSENTENTEFYKQNEFFSKPDNIKDKIIVGTNQLDDISNSKKVEYLDKTQSSFFSKK